MPPAAIPRWYRTEVVATARKPCGMGDRPDRGSLLRPVTVAAISRSYRIEFVATAQKPRGMRDRPDRGPAVVARSRWSVKGPATGSAELKRRWSHKQPP